MKKIFSVLLVILLDLVYLIAVGLKDFPYSSVFKKVHTESNVIFVGSGICPSPMEMFLSNICISFVILIILSSVLFFILLKLRKFSIFHYLKNNYLLGAITTLLPMMLLYFITRPRGYFFGVCY